jgi:hypothetical protein
MMDYTVFRSVSGSFSVKSRISINITLQVIELYIHTLKLGQHETSITQKRFFEHLQFWFRTAYLLWFAFYVILAAVSAVC